MRFAIRCKNEPGEVYLEAESLEACLQQASERGMVVIGARELSEAEHAHHAESAPLYRLLDDHAVEYLASKAGKEAFDRLQKHQSRYLQICTVILGVFGVGLLGLIGIVIGDRVDSKWEDASEENKLFMSDLQADSQKELLKHMADLIVDRLFEYESAISRTNSLMEAQVLVQEIAAREGAVYAATDSDQILEVIEQLASDNKARPLLQYKIFLEKVVELFDATYRSLELDRIDELVRGDLRGIPYAAYIMAKHYGERLAGDVDRGEGWDVADLERFEYYSENIDSDDYEILLLPLHIVIHYLRHDENPPDGSIEAGRTVGGCV